MYGSSSQSFPTALSGIIGRETAIASLVALLKNASVRIVTLVGLPGVGKTRLAQAVTAALLGQCNPSGEAPQPPPVFDKAYFVPLASAIGVNAVPISINIALGVDLRGRSRRHSLLTPAIQFLSDQNALLVLDNFEHVLEAKHIIIELLRACPQLKVMVTSREALNLYGEYRFPVEPLAFPCAATLANLPPAEAPETEPAPQLAQFPAIRLFLDRVHWAQPEFRLNADNHRAVIKMCELLGGLPLAIEMAAAQLAIYPAEVLVNQLQRNLSDLSTSLKGLAKPEHSNLSHTLNWSYNLLSPNEQRLLSAISLFSGPFTAEAAAAVFDEPKLSLSVADTGVGAPANTASADTETLLEGLVRKSLVSRNRSSSEGWYSLHSTIREFGRQQLRETGCEREGYQRIVAYYVQLTHTAHLGLFTVAHWFWLQRLDQEFMNLSDTMMWCIDHDVCQGLTIAIHCEYYSLRSRNYREIRHWIEQLLAASQSAIEERVITLRDHALGVSAALSRAIQGPPLARDQLEAALARRKRADDLAGMARLHFGIGYAHARSSFAQFGGSRSALTQALTHFQSAYEWYQRLNDQMGALPALFALIQTRQLLGLSENAALIETYASVAGQLNHIYGAGVGAYLVGCQAVIEGQADTAVVSLRRALLAFRDSEGLMGLVITLKLLTFQLLAQYRFEECAQIVEEGLQVVQRMNSPDFATFFDLVQALLALSSFPDPAAMRFVNFWRTARHTLEAPSSFHQLILLFSGIAHFAILTGQSITDGASLVLANQVILKRDDLVLLKLAQQHWEMLLAVAEKNLGPRVMDDLTEAVETMNLSQMMQIADHVIETIIAPRIQPILSVPRITALSSSLVLAPSSIAETVDASTATLAGASLMPALDAASRGTALAFGEWLRLCRTSNSMSRTYFGRKLNYSADLIKKIELGLRRPSHEFVSSLIQYLGIPQPLQSEFHRYARLNIIDEESYEILCRLTRLNVSVSV